MASAQASLCRCCSRTIMHSRFNSVRHMKSSLSLVTWYLLHLLLLSRRHTGAHVVRISLLWKPMQRHPDRTAVAGLNCDCSDLLQKAQGAVFGISPDPQFGQLPVGQSDGLTTSHEALPIQQQRYGN